MENFTFTGDWETTISLPYFAEKLTNKKFIYHAKTRELELYHLRITEVEDHSPDPTPAQMATIDFIKANEKEIFEKIFEFYKYYIYPEVRANWHPESDYQAFFPAFEASAHLDNVVGLSSIRVSPFEKDGLAYYDLGFEWVVDYEHGLSISFHGLRPLAFSAMGDGDYKVIFDDMGKSGFSWSEIMEEMTQKPEISQIWILNNGRFQPHPKYGKIKPWQAAANKFHVFWLIHNDKFEAFEAFYSNKENEDVWQINHALAIAILFKRPLFIDFILSKKPDRVYESVMNAIEQADTALIKRLLVFEHDINEQRGQDAYLCKLIDVLYKNYEDAEKRASYKEMMEYFIEKGANPYLEERWGRNAFCRLAFLSDVKIRSEIKAFVIKLYNIHKA